MPEDIQEKKITDKIQAKGERHWKKYREQLEQLESSPLAKVRPISSFDHYALGEQLETFEEMVAFNEAAGSISDLGTLPNIGLDVIGIGYGASPAAMVASIQPIDEETGTVWYKDVKAVDTAGNITAGDTIASSLAGQAVIPQNYASSQQSEAVGTGNDVLLQFTDTLTYLPVRPNTVSVVTTVGVAGAGGTITAVDDGNGNMIGVGISGGTINYVTGIITNLTYVTEPTDGVDLTATYQQDLEGATDIRELNYDLQSKSVTAHPYALKGVVGLFKKFSMQKRFGISGEEEIAMDLTNAINNEIFGKLLLGVNAAIAATGAGVTWDAGVPTEISEYAHRKAMQFAHDEAEGDLVTRAGRGSVSFIIAGSTAARYYKSLDGFVKLYDGNGISGAHLYGTYDGIPVIRVPLTAANGGMDPKVAYMGFKGNSPFEAAVTIAPFMPLTVTGMLPLGPNPLTSQRAAAMMTGVEVLVPNFLTKLTLTGI